jgi:hypothetical protein
MAGTKKLVRVRALRALVVFDDDVTAHLVPKGMQGTLVGAAPDSDHSDKKKVFSFVVEWDFHAIGDSAISQAECDPACCKPDFSVDEVPLDAIEVIGVWEVEDDEPAGAEEEPEQEGGDDALDLSKDWRENDGKHAQNLGD